MSWFQATLALDELTNQEAWIYRALPAKTKNNNNNNTNSNNNNINNNNDNNNNNNDNNNNINKRDQQKGSMKSKQTGKSHPRKR